MEKINYRMNYRKKKKTLQNKLGEKIDTELIMKRINSCRCRVNDGNFYL